MGRLVTERLLERPDKGAGKGKANVRQQQRAGRMRGVCGVVSERLASSNRSSTVDKRTSSDSEHCVGGGGCVKRWLCEGGAGCVKRWLLVDEGRDYCPLCVWQRVKSEDVIS